jgi:predicted peptidase
MRNRSLILKAIVLLGVALASFADSAETTNALSTQTAKQFRFAKSKNIRLNYLLYLPKEYQAKSEKRWPLILFLHGAGQRGEDIWRVADFGLPKNLLTNADFPFIVVSPQCPQGSTWSDDESLIGLIDEITAGFAVDPTRIYLTGLSMGGYGTWDLGLKYPERFAAIAPICGGGETIAPLLASAQQAAARKSLGVWAFHGAKDTLVLPEESERMVNFLKRAGMPDVKLTIYPEAEHDAWTETYNNPEFYEWLLKHQRTPVEK